MICLITAFLVFFSQTQASEEPRLVPLAVVANKELTEASGLIKSRQYDDIFWTHTDSGGKPKIYAIRDTGELVAEFRIEGAVNGDWEDITTDDAGNLYIGDIGNNLGLHRARFIYKVKEPDPNSTASHTIKPIEKLKYRYADDDRFDAESLMWHDGKLYIISKPRGRQPSLYRLEPTNEAHVLKPRKVTDLITRMPCAADVSQDGTKLLISTRSEIWIFPVDHQLIPISGAKTQHVWYPRTAMEGCCFDGDNVAMISESRGFYRVPKSMLEEGINFRDPILDKKK